MANFRLPVLRNDESTLKERMNENAYSGVLPARYLTADEEGNIIEEQEELFRRVAENIAVAEAAHVNEAVYVSSDVLRDEIVEQQRKRDGSVPFEGDVIEVTEETAKFVPYEAVSDIEKVRHIADKFTELMERLSFMPNTPTLANAGDRLQMLSACFVISPEDDMQDIHETAKEASLVFQSGGGMGYGFQNLRPYGDPVGSTGGIASGPLTFMETFDQTCETIAQGGMRRGAQMAIMKVSHPDVIQFIHAKNKDVSLAQTLRLNDPDDFTHSSFAEALEEARDLITDAKVPKHLRNAAEGYLSNFNISVGLTKDFMEAVKSDEEFVFTNPRTNEPHKATPETKELYEMFGLGEYVEVGEVLSVPAKEIWDRIAEGAHENGEPGTVFLDRINEEHSFDVEEHPEKRIQATNPCGEQPLMEYEACNLGHINLSTIVDEDRQTWNEFVPTVSGEDAVEKFLKQALDWEEFNRRIELGTRFLDNVVTMSHFPVRQIEESVRENRKIGLGVMGLAHLFVQLGVEYGSSEGDEIASQIMRHINRQSKQVSHELSRDRGTFENWEKSKWASPTRYRDWFEHHVGLSADSVKSGYTIRNHNTTTIAPTGTTSMVGNTTGGCEPIYSVANYKNVSSDVQGEEMLVQFDNLFAETLRENGYDVDEVKREAFERMEEAEFDGISSLSDIPEEMEELFVTTEDLSPKQHGSIQCALQEHVDSAISKTLNAPHDSTVEDAKEIFEYVYDNGGKGVTYYRDGTRAKQVYTTSQDSEAVSQDEITTDTVVSFLEQADLSQDELESVKQSVGITESVVPEERPKTLDGKTRRVDTGYGKMYVTLNKNQGELFEVMATVGKSGATMEADTEAIARLISLALRSGVEAAEVVEQLQDIKADRVAWEDGKPVRSVAEGIAVAIEEELDEEAPISDDVEVEVRTDGSRATGAETFTPGGCPTDGCSGNIVMQEGCEECTLCGWSKC